jgi:hypothetical protein
MLTWYWPRLGKCFVRLLMGDAHFSNPRLERGTVLYACADQRSVNWLVTGLYGFHIREGARLKAIDAKHLPKPIKMALRTNDKVATGTEELLKRIKSLNPGLHKENWRVLDSRDEHFGIRLILLVDRDTAKIIKGTSYKIFTGLSEGTFKLLSNPKEEIRGRAFRGRPRAVDTGMEGKGAGDSTSTEDREKQSGGDPMEAMTGDTKYLAGSG